MSGRVQRDGITKKKHRRFTKKKAFDGRAKIRIHKEANTNGMQRNDKRTN